jgi:hypothetical protein
MTIAGLRLRLTMMAAVMGFSLAGHVRADPPAGETLFIAWRTKKGTP